jgi:pimeloyl-ACP methyl ester carboxylesterase
MKNSNQHKLSTPQIIAVIFAILTALNVFGQKSYPFDVKITGTGTNDIILMPGLSCSGEVWNETIDPYQKKYKCHVLTMHGFAETAADSNSNFKNWEKGIVNYINDKKILKPIFIGHSIGGGMALLIASDYPDLLSKIIVVDALPCLGALQNPAFIAEKNPDCSPYVKQFSSLNSEQFYQGQKQMMPNLMADTVHLSQAIDWSVKSDRKTIAEIYCQFLNTDQRESIASIKCPALVLLEAPFAGMKTTIEEQFKNLKTGQLKYSDKALHFIMYDDTAWYLKQINAFLE